MQCVVNNVTRLCSDFVGFDVVPALGQNVLSLAAGPSMRRPTRRMWWSYWLHALKS